MGLYGRPVNRSKWLRTIVGYVTGMEGQAVDDSGLKIGEVADRTGMSVPSLRHYAHVGLVAPSGRSPGGFRLYSEADVEKILLVRRMKPLGFTLEQMRAFLDAAAILHGTDRRKGGVPMAGDCEQARAVVAEIGNETRARYAKLRTQITYAEEFLDLVTGLES